MESYFKKTVKAYSPGVGNIADLFKSLNEFGWKRYLSEDQAQKEVKSDLEESLIENSIEDQTGLITGIWKLSYPNSRIKVELAIQEYKQKKYFVFAHLTNFIDYDLKKCALLDISSVPTFVIRHVFGEADKCIYGMTDKDHNGIYLANKILNI
jgi:hypothetical protein